MPRFRFLPILAILAAGLAVQADEQVKPNEKPEAKPGAKPDPRPDAKPEAKSDEAIDFDRARELFRKKQSGGTLTADEEAYLQKAMEARSKGNAGKRPEAGQKPDAKPEAGKPDEATDFDRA